MTAVFDRTKFSSDVTEILLRDANTGKKIFDGDIKSVVPRARKSDVEKSARTRSIAEVFTPPHVVKFMVDAACDDSRIDSRWIEVACGEAPFITTRYDAESGEEIPVDERVGILDRKLRACPDNVDKFTWATRAVQSVYGYELQGDSLLLARTNVLLTVAEFVENIGVDELRQVAEIVTRNFWLMDGLNVPDAQVSLFADTPDCRVTDWRTGDEFFFTGGNAMKFDVLISNPPYQDFTDSDSTRMPPLYDKFMDAAFTVAEKTVLVTPARFLFNAGYTPKAWNQKMLNDPHFKVLDYAADATKYFRNVDIEGGVVITLYDKTRTFSPIGVFTPFEELNAIHSKVCVDNPNFEPLSKIMRGQMTYKLSAKAYEDVPDLSKRVSERSDTALRTNSFEVMPDIFLTDKPADGHEYLKILGRVGTQRVYRYVRREYMKELPEYKSYKVFLSEAFGRSNLGDEAAQIISPPIVGEPNEGCTQTFITIGAFDSRDEAENCLTYIKSKFARAMLGILKATQHNPPATWAKVPLQDFSSAGEIDWRVPVDEQLYRKYNLSDAEIAFIESHVKAM